MVTALASSSSSSRTSTTRRGPYYTSTLSLKLFLHCAQVADTCGYESISYEFFTQAFILYEDEISTDSKSQVQMLLQIIGALIQCIKTHPISSSSNSSTKDKASLKENFDVLVTKTTKYAAKLLKKTDQCRMVSYCAHLFWPVGREKEQEKKNKTKEQDDTNTTGSCHTEQTWFITSDGNRVLECCQRSIKIADSMNQSSSSSSSHSSVSQLVLFIDLLEKVFLYILYMPLS